jgi:hypothetical protein
LEAAARAQEARNVDALELDIGPRLQGLVGQRR